MKIESLTLKDFRSHESSHIAFDRLTFIVGANAAGKSSVAGAIEWLLTGLYAGVTDDGGRGAEGLLRKGTSRCDVTAKVSIGEDGFSMGRQRTRSDGTLSLSRPSQTIDGKQASEWLAKRLPPMQVLSALLNSSRFLDMAVAQQKKLLSQVLTDEGIAIPDDIRKGTEFTEGTRLSIAELDYMYKVAYEHRTDVNRTLKQYENLTAPAETNLPTTDSVQKKLSDLRHERDREVAARAKAIADAEGTPKRRKELRARIDQLTASKDAQDRRIEFFRTDLEEQIESRKSFILPMKEEKRLKAIVDAAATTASITANLEEKILEAREQKNRIVQLGAKAACPMCMRAMSKQDVTALVKIIDANIASNEETLQWSRIEDEKRKAAVEARAAISASISAVGEKEELERELGIGPEVDISFATGIENAEAELKVLPESSAAPDTSEVDKRISAVDERIAKGEKILLEVNEKRRELLAFNEGTKKRDAAQDELARLEKVLAFAGPDGARKQAAAGKLGAFTNSLNAALEKFGFHAEFSLEPFEMRVGGNTHALSVDQLSESERFRFSIAFQVALAKVTGVDLVVIDRADVLDKGARKMLTAMLLDSGIGQAIICSTTTDPVPERLPEGVRFVQLAQDGGVTRVVSVSPTQAVAA